MATVMNMGGVTIRVAGQAAQGARQVTNKQTGEVYYACDVAYMGGKKFVRLADPDQASRIRPGQFVVFECEGREFKDSLFVGAGVLVEVDGKPVGKSAA